MANPVGWFEVTGKDGKKLQDFYSGVFGWKIDANNPMNYGMVDNEGQGIGGGISGGDGNTQQVTFYIDVDDPQASRHRNPGHGHLRAVRGSGGECRRVDQGRLPLVGTGLAAQWRRGGGDVPAVPRNRMAIINVRRNPWRIQ